MPSRPKRRTRTSPPRTQVAANVFLRSASGKSYRELAGVAAAVDLSLYLPPPSARDAICTFFERRGFRVFRDASGLTVSIQGPRTLFEKEFGVGKGRLVNRAPSETVSLAPAEQIRHLVEEIVVVPAPELFR